MVFLEIEDNQTLEYILRIVGGGLFLSGSMKRGSITNIDITLRYQEEPEIIQIGYARESIEEIAGIIQKYHRTYMKEYQKTNS